MIYLTGFMGSGKTSVGRELAGRMHVPFVDMDDRIVAMRGSSIPEIFKYAGEKAFRAIEQDILFEIAGGEEGVVATGGGLPLDPVNRVLMKASGVIVHLRTNLATLKTRVMRGLGRPLWDQDVDKLFASRADAYTDTDLIIDTDGLTVGDVVSRVMEKTKGFCMPVPVILKERPYPIYIGDGILREIKTLIFRHMQPEGLFVMVDKNALMSHASQISEALSGIHHHLLEVPSGEGSKSYGFLEEVLGEMLSSQMNRQWVCMAVGGGVTGDLAGFASNIFMRGIPVIQVPTTLLAQVDASIGGKTAINLEKGKNLIGTFYQPTFVLCDTSFLGTLDDMQIKAGLAEVIKYGIIMDYPLFEYLEGWVCDYEKIVRMCCRDKASVVSRDEREDGLRRILNFGHTLGHALEKCMLFQIHHGQAVAFGLLFATWLSHDMGILSLEDKQRIYALVNRYGIIPEGICSPDREEIGDAMAMDKKAVKEDIRFALTPGIGDVTVKRLSLSHILDAYERFRHGYKEGI